MIIRSLFVILLPLTSLAGPGAYPSDDWNGYSHSPKTGESARHYGDFSIGSDGTTYLHNDTSGITTDSNGRDYIHNKELGLTYNPDGSTSIHYDGYTYDGESGSYIFHY